MELIKDLTGKPFGPVLNAAQGFWLPSDTPYGNLQPKLFRILWQLGHANQRLVECSEAWKTFLAEEEEGPARAAVVHYFTLEESVFMIRRATDELVALVWLLEQRRATGSYPTKLAFDSVDGAVKCSHALFGRHTDFLTMLNNVANAHKHSFLQSDISIVGSDEPMVFALGLQRNNLKNVPTFHQVSLAILTESFNAFLRDCLQHLRGL